MPPTLLITPQTALPQGTSTPSSPEEGHFPPGFPRLAPSSALPAVCWPPGLPAPKPSAEQLQLPAHTSRSNGAESAPARSALSAQSAQRRHLGGHLSRDVSQQAAQLAKPAASQATSAAAKKATGWQAAAGKPKSRGQTGKQAANPKQLTLDELQQQGRALPAAFTQHTPTALKVTQTEDELLTKLAAELAPGEAVTAVAAKQRRLEAAVAEKYALSTTRSAAQTAEPDRAGDKSIASDTAEKNLQIEASQRAAQMVSTQQVATSSPAKVEPSSAKVDLDTRQPGTAGGSNTAKKKAAARAKKEADFKAGAVACTQARAAAEVEAETQAQAASQSHAQVTAAPEAQSQAQTQAVMPALKVPAEAQAVADTIMGADSKPTAHIKPAAAVKSTAKTAKKAFPTANLSKAAHQPLTTDPNSAKSEAPRLGNSQPHRQPQQGTENTKESPADVPDETPAERRSHEAEIADRSAMQRTQLASATSQNSRNESTEPYRPPKQGRKSALTAASQTHSLAVPEGIKNYILNSEPAVQTVNPAAAPATSLKPKPKSLR